MAEATTIGPDPPTPVRRIDRAAESANVRTGMHQISLVVTSYDHPNALRLVLEGLQQQEHADFELVIADDGSDGDTFELLEEFALAGMKSEVTTHEDRGFRKSKALNNAIRKTTGDQIIFLDGDCVPFSDFVRRHAEAWAPMSYAVGGYVWTNLEQASAITAEDVRAGRHTQLLTARERANLWSVHLRNLFYRVLRKPRKPKILGGNFSVARDALHAINGFEEGFDGFSGEDSDIRNRLNNLGARPVSLWNRAFVVHLDHGLDPARCRPEVMRRRGERTLLRNNRDLVRTPRGLVWDTDAPPVADD